MLKKKEEIKKKTVRKTPRVKTWFCNRLGAVTTEEFDEYIDEFISILGQLDNYISKQDSFNKLVGKELKLGVKDYTMGTVNMYG